MANSWDVFFSYRRHDLERARPLLEELARAGISVWRDEDEIPEQASVTSSIREAIASCRVFLAFYSSTYWESNPCQEEIATAWLAAQRLGESPNRRIWIVNPETSFDHILDLFRDQQSGSLVAETVRQLKQALVAASGTLPGRANLPVYHGMSSLQASRLR